VSGMKKRKREIKSETGRVRKKKGICNGDIFQNILLYIGFADSEFSGKNFIG
jgi:hypothetical protein